LFFSCAAEEDSYKQKILVTEKETKDEHVEQLCQQKNEGRVAAGTRATPTISPRYHMLSVRLVLKNRNNMKIEK